MEKYSLEFSIQVDGHVLDFQGPPLDKELSYKLCPRVSKLLGDIPVDRAVKISKYDEVTRSIAPGFPEP